MSTDTQPRNGGDRESELDCEVVELRRYTLHPGARETLISLFDRELVETQEATGMRVLGQFRDLEDLDAFVFLRGFRDMPARGRALEAFYGGPVWDRHGPAASATMIDSRNVLLLRPAKPRLPDLDPNQRRAPGGGPTSSGLLTATICHIDGNDEAFASFFEHDLEPALRDAGADVLAGFTSEHAENNFPRLPVRENEEVFVWLACFADEAAEAWHRDRLDLAGLLAGRVQAAPETWRLSPTSRSLLPGGRS